MSFKYPIRTRYSETAQDGIIHHSSYVIYLEVARCEFLKSLGFEINELEKRKIFCPVVDLSLKYTKPIYSFEDLHIEVFLQSFTGVRFNLNYKIWRESICTTSAATTHCFLNEAFKPIPIPKLILEQFKMIQQLP